MLNNKRKESLKELIKKLGITKNINYTLVHQSLIHPSYFFDKSGKETENNQRLEFLGDAVVGMVIGKYMYEEYPQKTEGELTKMRAAVVCESSLANAAKSLNLGEYLLLGKGEEFMGGKKRPSNLADSFEAFIGAIYLSTSLIDVESIILKALKNMIGQAAKGNFGDYKTQLQEFIQQDRNKILSYKILWEDGPDHDKIFCAGVFLNEEEIARGKGRTKKEAEQQAAKLSLEKLGVVS